MGFQSGFRINTNTSAVNTYRSYSSAQAGLERNIERLSSGLRINRAADDSAGLAISQRMNNQIKGMQQANRNVQQGNNMLQTAEGGLNQIHSILGRMRELAVQSASDGLNADDRASIDLEFQQLKSEISRIGNGTEYNGMTLINGDRAKNLVSGESNSIGGNMVNDSSLGSTKVASFAANGDYTLQAQKPDGSGGFTAATTLAEATQFTLTVGSESQTVVRAGDQGNGFNDVDGSQINFDELGIVTDTSLIDSDGEYEFSVDDGNYILSRWEPTTTLTIQPPTLEPPKTGSPSTWLMPRQRDWPSKALIWTVWVMPSRPSIPWMRLSRRSMTNAVTSVPCRTDSNIPVPT